MATAFGTISSVATTTFNVTGDIDVSKPASLTEGDLMVAVLQIGTANDGVYSATGWSEVDNELGSVSSVTVLAKVATSGDVAASDFTFTPSGTQVGSSDEMSGFIIRFTGNSFTGAENVKASFFQDNAATTTKTFSNGIVPFSTGSVFVLVACNAQSNVGAQSGYAITNNDPTWTERIDYNSSAGSFGVATATPSAVSDTGDSTVVYTASEASTGILMAVQEDTNQTVTHSLLTQSPTFTKPVLSVGTTTTHSLLTQSPTINNPSAKGSAPTQWSNPDKPSTDWLNPDKL